MGLIAGMARAEVLTVKRAAALKAKLITEAWKPGDTHAHGLSRCYDVNAPAAQRGRF